MGPIDPHWRLIHIPHLPPLSPCASSSTDRLTDEYWPPQMHSAITMAEIRSNPDALLGQMVFCIIYVVLLCFLIGRRGNVFYGDLKEYYLGTVNKVYNHKKKLKLFLIKANIVTCHLQTYLSCLCVIQF